MDKIVDYNLWPKDDNSTDYIEILIIKGARGRYSYYKGNGDEQS